MRRQFHKADRRSIQDVSLSQPVIAVGIIAAAAPAISAGLQRHTMVDPAICPDPVMVMAVTDYVAAGSTTHGGKRSVFAGGEVRKPYGFKPYGFKPYRFMREPSAGG